ncbi:MULTISPECIES: aminotransferase class V-fold PLP-dependent enzyme [Paraburkholderia]|uniref:Aminotransferase class V-fold PLP-dependent enzyme n=1 Tax=Paraburkholderia dipogonis TaxID=1211383 RepID=A0ABW9B6U2_9BURK
MKKEQQVALVTNASDFAGPPAVAALLDAGLTHMLHWTGRVLPVKRLCSLGRTLDIITVVDGAQTFARMPVSFRELDCDFFATSLHEWLGAPVGNGMLIVRQSRIDET